MEALAWIEQTRLSLFVREDFYAYFVLLIGHAWGMTFLQVDAALDPRPTSSALPQRGPAARQRGAYSRIGMTDSLARRRAAGELALATTSEGVRDADTERSQAPRSEPHEENG